MTEQLQDLTRLCSENGRVCPQPLKWNEMWDMLPNKHRKGFGWEPAVPLILAAWWESSPAAKQERFQFHLKYAAENGALDKIDTFLRGLVEKDWFHGND